MSFTAEVKDELSRVEGTCELCEVAELSALVRVCGTLTFHGSGRYSIRIATETGAVARTVIKLTHKIFNLETTLTVRRSVLHKTRNYLIEIPEQDGLEEALVRMGVLVLGRGLSSGIAARVVARPCCRAAYLRGAFMAGEEFADDLMELLDDEGITTRVNHRRGAYALYLKSFDDVISLLSVLGATRTAQAVRNVRRMKSVKNDVNRRVNAEIANQARSTDAAADQIELIDAARRDPGLDALPPAVREFCEMRLAHPELSLRELGHECDPPLSKSALYHRLLRLQSIVGEKRACRRLGSAS